MNVPRRRSAVDRGIPRTPVTATRVAAAVFPATNVAIRSAARGYVARGERPIPTPGAPMTANDLPAGSASGRVLIVDDEMSIRIAIGRYLRRCGYVVEEAESGAEALRVVEQKPPFDLILSDLRMPDMDGPQLLEALRAIGRGDDRRVVMMTGDVGEWRDTFAEAGVPVMAKPFKLQVLQTILERFTGDGAR